jgi:hypothetical protein
MADDSKSRRPRSCACAELDHGNGDFGRRRRAQDDPSVAGRGSLCRSDQAYETENEPEQNDPDEAA